jgi:hypothetical protein
MKMDLLGNRKKMSGKQMRGGGEMVKERSKIMRIESPGQKMEQKRDNMRHSFWLKSYEKLECFAISFRFLLIVL